MKIAVYNQSGKKVEEIELPKEMFEVPFNSDLVHQVAVVQLGNQRQLIAKTKDRSEVRGGGKKPWRQKGTGRARHGSRRSPLWRGGGITFGPSKERVFKKKINKKIRKKALFMVLSAKAKENLLVLLDQISLEEAKTKLAKKLLGSLPIKGTALVALPKVDKNMLLAFRNLSGVELAEARNLNVLDLLQFKYLIMPKESIKAIEKTFLK